MTTQLPDEAILSWDFFIQRFETLTLESQLSARSDDSSFVQGFSLLPSASSDLMHSDPMSDVYQRKLTKAKKAIEEASSVRSIVRCLKDTTLRHQLPFIQLVTRMHGQ